jgi:SAM-dependent methyltransferase
MPGQPTAVTRACPEEIRAALPPGWSLDDAAALDLDAALADATTPPLPHPDSSFRLIWSESAFTRMDDGWAAWLLEARRLLAGDGLLVVGLAPPAELEHLTGQAWDDSQIGMTVIVEIKGTPARAVFHSEWWLRARWGRAFEIVAIEESPRRAAVMRRRSTSVTAADLERPGADDQRELTAALANAELLRAQLDLFRERGRRELEDQREEIGRELMRRSFAAADQEWSRGGPSSPAALVAAEYEATTSWRLTRPLRALGAMLRRVR